MANVTKKQLRKGVGNTKTETKQALEELFGEINKGQQKQLVKKENIKKLFDRYGVDYES